MDQPTTKVPCPMCGSENEHGATFCTVCGCSLEQASSNAGGHKCARCGQLVPEGFDFCPVCGLDQRQRFARPATKIVRIDRDAPAGGPPPQDPGAGYPGQDPAAGYPGHGGEAQPAPYQHPPHGQHPNAGPYPGGPGQQPYGNPPAGQPPYQPPQGGGPGASQGGQPPHPSYGAVHPGDPGAYAPPEGAGSGPSQPAGVPGAGMYVPPVGPTPGPSIMATPGPSQTGRTVFHEGPPLARPPTAADDDLTIPALSRYAEAPASLDAGLPVSHATPAAVEQPGPRGAGQFPSAEAPPLMPPSGPTLPTDVPAAPGPNAGPGWGAASVAVPEGWRRPAEDPLEDAVTSESQAVRPQRMESAPPVDFDDIQTAVEPPSAHPTNPGLSAARLVLVGRDGDEGDSFPMTGEQIAVGREEGDILFPDDAFMSPTHARIERNGEVYTLVDLGSSNGIYLRIRGNATVYPGDLFMVGHQLLRLENVIEPVQEQPPGHDGTRLFGTPLKPAWGKLVLVGRGGVTGDHYHLRGAKVVFGREQGDLLFPLDPFVSREHARLRLELHGSQMSVFLEDLGSANGTYIRIRGSAEVRGRDTFRVGDQILRLRLDR